MNRQRAILALEDGTVFRGTSFGAGGEKTGEVVFNTGMTGYQEVITDPSYKGQIVTMTYPHIGNYGINEEDSESEGVQIEGFVVREYCPFPSNWRSRTSLGHFLERRGVVAVEGVDTRALTRHIREQGAMRGVISTQVDDEASLVEKARAWPGLVGADMVRHVTCVEPYRWNASEGGRVPVVLEPDNPISVWGGADPMHHVVVVDFGVKYGILRALEDLGCAVVVVPASWPAKRILTLEPTGVLLSNGPGDPAGLPYVVDTVRSLLTEIPIMGICLGHQLLGLGLGGRTFKLKFGHRGSNHPVKDLATGKVEITTQNHGFCVDTASLLEEDVVVTHLNLNDQTVEGMRHARLPIFSIQYHPEASPGPHDSRYLFGRFSEMMES